MIKRLKNHQIDKLRWDAAIYNSDDPHIYLLSWYLDIVSPNWECFVEDDYTWVFPLPIKHKFGIPYLVQPQLCQKLGVYGIGVKSSTARKFYKKLYWQFPYFNLQLNNSLGLEQRKYLNGRINYTLDLTPTYEVLKKDYHENTLRNIKKASAKQLRIHDCEIDEFLGFSKVYMKGLSEEQFPVYNLLIKEAFKKKAARLIKVTGNDGQMLACACFLVWNQQILYLEGAASEEGKNHSAMFLLFDSIIKEYSETGWLLDFEGSMIAGVAKFFRGFGAKASYYYHLKKYLFIYR